MMAKNGSNQIQMAGKGQKWPEIDLKLMEMARNGLARKFWVKYNNYMQKYVAAELA